MINYEYLDLLYKWKMEAENELEEIQQQGERKISQEEEAKYGLAGAVEIHILKRTHAEAMARTYTLCIREYLKPKYD